MCHFHSFQYLLFQVLMCGQYVLYYGVLYFVLALTCCQVFLLFLITYLPFASMDIAHIEFVSSNLAGRQIAPKSCITPTSFIRCNSATIGLKSGHVSSIVVLCITLPSILRISVITITRFTYFFFNFNFDFGVAFFFLFIFGGRPTFVP